MEEIIAFTTNSEIKSSFRKRSWRKPFYQLRFFKLTTKALTVYEILRLLTTESAGRTNNRTLFYSKLILQHQNLSSTILIRAGYRYRLKRSMTLSHIMMSLRIPKFST
ncbi:unnamed protein product [Allacma fusca]|uniref:Uncharacterized protein n=1 Tax=Allacma fusca TaxID=39272 RepID=A0A8J2LGH0_9HEXA|nr:unnamed protein product [Allacma fusca]